MGKDFNPLNPDRPPRSKGYKEETREIFEIIENRGDQRIGQLILNAVRREHGDGSVEQAANSLWNLEAPELLKLLQEMNQE